MNWRNKQKRNENKTKINNKKPRSKTFVWTMSKGTFQNEF
jgi:hypothetical protein